MNIIWLTGKGICLAPILFILLMFFVPMSPTLKSIFLIAGLIAILFTPYYNKHILYAYNTLWGRAALLFFIFILIACFWSPAPYSMQWSVIEKYSKLLYLPILTAVFINPKVRYWSINAYLAAMFITCIISILKVKGVIAPVAPVSVLYNDPGDVFYNHIITGFMMALASYWAGILVFEAKGWIRTGYFAFVLLTSYQVLFINTGRTGYLIYFILMTFLFFQKLPFKKALSGAVLFIAILALVYQQSPIMQNRIQDLVNDIHFLQQNNQNTSLGYRIQFHQYAKSLLKQHPLFGMGTGSFKYKFAQDNPVPSWGTDLPDPHSQYWMVLAEQGILGLILLCGFLGTLFLTLLKLRETKAILWGMLIAFCIGSISDTILCFSTAGYLLIVISALCFGELIEQNKPVHLLDYHKEEKELSTAIAHA